MYVDRFTLFIGRYRLKLLLGYIRLYADYRNIILTAVICRELRDSFKLLPYRQVKSHTYLKLLLAYEIRDAVRNDKYHIVRLFAKACNKLYDLYLGVV